MCNLNLRGSTDTLLCRLYRFQLRYWRIGGFLRCLYTIFLALLWSATLRFVFFLPIKTLYGNHSSGPSSTKHTNQKNCYFFPSDGKCNQMMVSNEKHIKKIQHKLAWLCSLHPGVIANLFPCASWYEMPQFLSPGIMWNRQSKHWCCLAQEEEQTDVGKLRASRITGVWQ